MKLLRRSVGVVLLAVVLQAAAPAAASEQHPTLAELEHEVMCPTCKQLLELSDAPVADRIRAFIRVRIAAGDTKSEIEHRLVSEFGEAVLASPPVHGFDVLAWLLPFAGLAGVGTAIAVVAVSWRRRLARSDPRGDMEMQPLDPVLARRLEEELALYDA